jgi:hypothetical protein
MCECGMLGTEQPTYVHRPAKKYISPPQAHPQWAAGPPVTWAGMCGVGLEWDGMDGGDALLSIWVQHSVT